ncbi:hypothetical protein AGMMS49587_08060 [Spirochaetia bacterium]|nr:hypothetical protein AGMMS49587_08060 [Spirochaetia bacterium]
MKKFLVITIIVVILIAGSQIFSQTAIYYTAKVPENYNAILGKEQREIVYEENGIQFHYDCNSIVFKSVINGQKPHRGARFYIAFETAENISNISIDKCKFENKGLKYSHEQNYENEKLNYRKSTTKDGKNYIWYEIVVDDFAPEHLFDSLFGISKLKDTEYETEFTVKYEINNIQYVTILKGIFWCYVVSGPIWLWT